MTKKPIHPKNTSHQQHNTQSPMLNKNNIGNNAQNNYSAPMYNNPNIQPNYPHPYPPYPYPHNIGPLPQPHLLPLPSLYDDVFNRLSKDMKDAIMQVKAEVKAELKAEQNVSPKDNIAGVQEPMTNVSNLVVAPQQQEIIDQPMVVPNNQNVALNFTISELFLKQMIYGFSIKNRLHISLYIDIILFLTQLLEQTVHKNWDVKNTYTPGEILLQSFTNPTFFGNNEIANYLRTAIKHFINVNESYLIEFFGILYKDPLYDTSNKKLSLSYYITEINKFVNFLKTLDNKRFVFDKTKIKTQKNVTLNDKAISKKFGFIFTGILQEFLSFTKQGKFELLQNICIKKQDYELTYYECSFYEKTLKDRAPLFIAYLNNLDVNPKKVSKEAKKSVENNNMSEQKSSPETEPETGSGL